MKAKNDRTDIEMEGSSMKLYSDRRRALLLIYAVFSLVVFGLLPAGPQHFAWLLPLWYGTTVLLWLLLAVSALRLGLKLLRLRRCKR